MSCRQRGYGWMEFFLKRRTNSPLIYSFFVLPRPPPCTVTLILSAEGDVPEGWKIKKKKEEEWDETKRNETRESKRHFWLSHRSGVFPVLWPSFLFISCIFQEMVSDLDIGVIRIMCQIQCSRDMGALSILPMSRTLGKITVSDSF